jgi:hypothetical protein
MKPKLHHEKVQIGPRLWAKGLSEETSFDYIGQASELPRKWKKTLVAAPDADIQTLISFDEETHGQVLLSDNCTYVCHLN